MEYEIKCVDLEDDCSYKDCRCIKFIGIANNSGGANKYTPEEIYHRISKGENFFVSNGGTKTYLEKVEREGTKYVRTEPNDTEKDNLLNQTSCNF